MEPGQPSRTAMAAAGHRMIHQLVDQPLAFRDPLAIRILGPPPPEAPGMDAIRTHADETRPLRAQIIARSRFAEETLAEAVAEGVDQYVLLGAGLDTFAYRNPWPRLRVFEVDNPESGRWKRQQLALNAIPVPPSVRYAPIDFERETLAEALERAGFDPARPGVFAWLGVTVYLSREAILATLAAVASLPRGTQIVFDYGEPRERLSAAGEARMRERMAFLASIGEPWISFFQPGEMARMLAQAGFAQAEDLNGEAINLRWFSGRTDGLATTQLAHLVRASV